MARFLHSFRSFTFRKCNSILLALSWVSGLGFGGFVFRYAGSDLASRMPLAAKSQPSIFGLLISFLLPFLFSALAVYLGVFAALFGICFCKAFLLGYICSGVFAAFGSGSWLVRWLLLFTDLWGATLVYHYARRHISGVRAFSLWELGTYLSLGFLVAILDICCISPLLLRCVS